MCLRMPALISSPSDGHRKTTLVYLAVAGWSFYLLALVNPLWEVVSLYGHNIAYLAILCKLDG